MDTKDEQETFHEDRLAIGHEAARRRFGGVNPGAAFFGWLVAIGVAILLSGILGAAAAALGETADLTRDDLEGQAGDLGVGAVVALMVVLFVGYCCGGYVAGRMSRFDGARQGLAVWVLGLVVTLLAVGLGALFGSQYDVLDRVDLPRIPFSDGELTAGGVIAGLVVLVVTLIGAMLGGAVGHRYHDRVDRVAGRSRRPRSPCRRRAYLRPWPGSPGGDADDARLFTAAFVLLGVADLAYFTAVGVAIHGLPLYVTGPIGSDEAGAGPGVRCLRGDRAAVPPVRRPALRRTRPPAADDLRRRAVRGWACCCCRSPARSARSSGSG